MTRAARLLTLVQALRRRRRPVSAAALATELGVSLRTVYRDIETLQAEGAPIAGEAGLGYVLKPGFFLPPLMFSDDEIDAVVFGLRLAMARGGETLGTAAADALAKVAAILPPAQQDAPEANGFLAGPARETGAILDRIRQAIKAERKLHLRYADKAAKETDRIVWPVAVGFFAGSEVLAAWCELRTAFRYFRLDRIAAATIVDAPLPRRHRILLAEWRSQELDGID